MIPTFSIFYYGHQVTVDNFMLDFKEGAGPQLTAEIANGSYTLTDFCTAVKDALNNEGSLVYTVTVSRTTRKITVAASGTFSLLCSSGTHVGTSIWTLLGFSGADKTGTNTYTAGSASGSQYTPQFRLQDVIKPEHWQQAASATVNETGDGSVEVVQFGTKKFLQLNIMYATNRPIGDGGHFFKSNPTGVEDLTTFMQYITLRTPIEIMYDIDNPSSYSPIILDTTPFDGKGTGYELKELYDKGLPDIFESGKLKFRLIED